MSDFSAASLDQILKIPNVLQVTSDSRAVRPGTIFVAVRGVSQDGHAFLIDAQKAGAVGAVGEIEAPAGLQIPYVRVDDSRDALAALAAQKAGHPSRSMLMVGVTGTSGKTTTTYLIESILREAGHLVGVIGTVNFRYGNTVLESTHTTPGPVELQSLLARMLEAGCTAVVMEVSSHALKQKRVEHIAFDGMVFNNLSREHLDFHPDMEDYFRAKARLFLDLAHASWQAGKNPVAAINSDDEYGRRLIAEVSMKAQPFGLEHTHHSKLHIGMDGIDGTVGKIRIHSALTGKFNAHNILGAVTVCHSIGILQEAIEKGISSLAYVPGRLERVEDPAGRHILVDYAHKPDALEKVLQTLRDVRESGRKLITVFGCGGDRDRTKRPVMGKLAVELSDHAWITSDNPRREDPQAIISEIVNGTAGHSNFTVQPDRREAIRGAVRMAGPGDIVLIAGKGHEDYQIIADPTKPSGTHKIRFDDREEARAALG